MKPLQPHPHGIIDYIMGIILLISPWLFNFSISGVATSTFVILGLITIGISLFTDYALAIRRAIPFSTHRAVEIVIAIVLLISPWIFGYADVVGNATVLAVVLAVIWLVVVALTNYSFRHGRQAP
jgi:hypothetical protein